MVYINLVILQFDNGQPNLQKFRIYNIFKKYFPIHPPTPTSIYTNNIIYLYVYFFYYNFRSIINCNNKDYNSSIVMHGNYWVFKNYIKANHGGILCSKYVTYTTHGDLTFLGNVMPLVLSWMAPISMAVYAPGDDFERTIESIRFLRNCPINSEILRHFVTFHIYFDLEHIPNNLTNYTEKTLNAPYDCKIRPPYETTATDELYKNRHQILYPINVGRNIARSAALTKYVLASDVELYPSSGISSNFIKMIERNDLILQRPNPK